MPNTVFVIMICCYDYSFLFFVSKHAKRSKCKCSVFFADTSPSLCALALPARALTSVGAAGLRGFALHN